MDNLPWRERVIFAYIDEPPFAWTGEDGTPFGCDVAVALRVLRSLGVEQIETRRVTFAELIPGVIAQQWTINTPIFITPERGKLVRFSRPVWALSDGLMLRADAPSTLKGYASIAQDSRLRLGVVRDQVQHQTALRAGIPAERIDVFETQEAVVAALLEGRVDAYAATTIGHRAYLTYTQQDGLRVVDTLPAYGVAVPPRLGAYSFAKTSTDLADAFDGGLAEFLGSAAHRALMRAHGFTEY
ncbi:MAG: transporter substrate-binding domain-containing protein [Anaerolineae bacterium]|nr:transporter substrate-binding domain-containing protein [Anaerolineae bacterium]